MDKEKTRRMNQKLLKLRVTVLTVVMLLAGMLTKNMSEVKAESGITLKNPQKDSKGKVTWDCVYFGNYPQSDATGKEKDPIKWRVLSVNGDDAFLLADVNLDIQPYSVVGEEWSDELADVTWETCTLRSWLNGYGSGKNKIGYDYGSDNFISNAFTKEEQDAIKTTTVVNKDNSFLGTKGGNNTEDKIFILSFDEVTNLSYGFSYDYTCDDNARVRNNTAYVDAKNKYATWWWLRTPGRDSSCAMDIGYGGGYIGYEGAFVYTGDDAVCPALHLDLSSSDLWSYAGTVSSEGGADPVDPSPDTPSEEESDDSEESSTENMTEQTADDSATEKPTEQATDKATTGQPTTDPATTESKLSLPSVGTTKTLATGTYKVIASSSTKKQASFVKPKSTKKTVVSIPATVKIDGQTYQVTEIAAKAFKNNTKLKSVMIGKNVAKIGKESFYGCKKLSKITIDTTKLTSKKVGSKAFKGIAAKATIKVPKSKLTPYKKMLKAKGVGSGAKIKKK